MTQFDAIRYVKDEIERQGYPYEYLDYYKSDSEGVYFVIDIDTLHYTFSIGRPINEIQVSITFNETCLSVLAFPHPVIIEPEQLTEVIKFINHVNAYIRLPDIGGRFYVDTDTLDVAYSTTISYNYLQAFSQNSITSGIFGFAPFIGNIAIPLYKVAQGIIAAEEACKQISDLWSI